MADETKTQSEFLDWLAQFPDKLADMVRIIEAFLAQQGKVTLPADGAEGPRKWTIGGTVPGDFEGITAEQLDALSKGMADAVVIERALAFIKGFIVGLVWAGGGA